MKKVLIAIDYDQTAQKVAERGFSLAKAMNAQITLLHVISKPVLYYNAYMASAPIQIKNESELYSSAQKFLNKIKTDLGDDTIQVVVKEGDTVEVILESAKKLKAEIIVIGTHSRKWLENILMGSVAENVLKHTNLALFIIPTQKESD